MSFFFQRGGGLGQTKSFEALFFCLEAIKSKQMPMYQKAKNSDFFLFLFLLNNFGKKWKKCLENSKSEGGGGQRLLKKTHI